MRRLLGFACAALALLGPAVARADDAELAALLEEDVVAGPSRTAEVAADAPATTSVLTADDIRRYGLRSLDEAIDFLAMGLVTQNPLHSVEVGGRGVLLSADYGHHVVLVVDGHVVNEGWAQAAYFEQGLGLPLELIDRVEIILGPGSVMYGGNAMLGVISIVTKHASQLQGARVVLEGTGSPGQSGGRIDSFAWRDLGGSYRAGANGGHVLTVLGRAVELTGGVERYQAHGPTFVFAPETVTNDDGTPKNFGPRAIAPGVWGGPVRHAYETEVTSGYVRAAVGELVLAARAAVYSRTTPYLNYINQTIGDFDDGRSHERDRWLSLDAAYNRQLTPKLGLALHGHVDSYDYEQPLYTSSGSDCPISTPGPCRFASIGASRWGGIGAQLAYDWRGDGRVETLVGTMGQLRWVAAKTDSQDQATGVQMGSVGAARTLEVPWAVYAQQRWRPVSWLHLNAGLRADEAPRGGFNLSPRVAAAADVWRGGTLKAIGSQAFRPATFYEATFEAPGQVPAPHLAPEHEKSVELTLEQRHGRHRLLMGVFRTWWTDLIALQLLPDGSGDAQYQNSARIDNAGYNARAEGGFGPLRYGLSVTGAYTRREDPSGKAPLPVAPSIFGNARLAYELPRGHAVAVAGQLVGPRLADRALDGGWPVLPVAPTQARLKLTFTGPVPAVRGLAYRVGADVATAGPSAYVAGPVQSSDPSRPTSAQLAPVNRLTALVGLQYELF